MATKLTYSIITAMILVVGCTAGKTAIKQHTAIGYLKNYALCTCIADGFQSNEVIKDSAASARGYLEFGDLPLEAHTEATLLGRQYLKKEYKSMTGEKLILMKCIDFYNSKELNDLAKKYAKKQ